MITVVSGILRLPGSEGVLMGKRCSPALLARDEVTLVCYCTDPARCHRTVLAGILGKLGANVRGERT